MGNRNLEYGTNYSKGLVYLDFSFLTNGGSDPSLATLRGVTNPSTIASITYAATGKYTVKLADPYRYIVAKSVDLEDVSSPDGAYASIGNVSHEGDGGTLTFVVSTFAANGTLTAFSNRRVSVQLTFKNSTVGV